MKKEIKIVNIESMGDIEFTKLRSNNKRKLGNPIKESSLLKKVNSNDIQKTIDNKYVLEILPKNKMINVYTTNPKNLLSPYRFDVFIKFMYVEAFNKNINLDIAKDIYLNHIKAFNNFCEPYSEKNGEEAFLNSFNQLINDIKENGFKDFFIPVSDTGEIIDGAHRLAIALYYDIEVKFILLDALDARYDYDFFIKRNFEKSYLDLVIKFLRERKEWNLTETTNLSKIKNKIDVYYEECISPSKYICLIRTDDIKNNRNKIY